MFGQKRATTEDGQIVLLKSNVTWVLDKTPPKKPEVLLKDIPESEPFDDSLKAIPTSFQGSSFERAIYQIENLLITNKDENISSKEPNKKFIELLKTNPVLFGNIKANSLMAAWIDPKNINYEYDAPLEALKVYVNIPQKFILEYSDYNIKTSHLTQVLEIRATPEQARNIKYSSSVLLLYTINSNKFEKAGFAVNSTPVNLHGLWVINNETREVSHKFPLEK